jgi:dipeptidyl aminopeptidase/acylaminoacyl peptidase
MKPTDIAQARIPGRPAVSPDGTQVVVAVSRADLDANDYAGDLWIAPADGSSPPRRLTGGWRDSAPTFSPDGQWLAFVRAVRDDDGKVGKPQLYVLPMAGGEARKLTDEPLGVDEPVWSPDSTRLAYTARVPEEGRYGTTDGVDAGKEPPRRITKFFYRVDDLGFLLDRPKHVFVISLADGAEPTRVTDGPYDHTEVDWSPAGGLLAFAAARHETWNDDLVRDIWVCAEDGSGVRVLTDGTLSASQPRFTPDGATVTFAGAEADDVVINSESLWSVPVDGSAPAGRLTDRERYHLAFPGGHIEPHKDGVLFPNEVRGAVELLLVPYDGGESRPCWPAASGRSPARRGAAGRSPWRSRTTARGASCTWVSAGCRRGTRASRRCRWRRSPPRHRTGIRCTAGWCAHRATVPTRSC